MEDIATKLSYKKITIVKSQLKNIGKDKIIKFDEYLLRFKALEFDHTKSLVN